ncbi:MAG: glycosyltransferase family 2 protein [Flavobacteriaceae bacterium]
MLSVLIPTYNYYTLPLVQVIQRQAQIEAINYEILVFDDASPDTQIIEKNQAINDLAYCCYKVHEQNLGRAENRNQLALKAQYDWLLFLDCDTQPTSADLIKNYLAFIKNATQNICFGGLAYQKTPPPADELLRWIYGQKREALPVDVRSKNPYQSALVSNILIKRDLVLKHPFDAKLKKYGFEDFAFLDQLKKEQFEIAHIANPVFHLNLEKSSIFLQKHLEALKHLHELIKQDIIKPEATSIGKWTTLLEKFKLDLLVLFFHRFWASMIKQNLLSKKPSMLLFDLYKLGYFCSIKT